MWSRVQVEGEEAVAVVRRGAGQIVGMVLMAIIIIFALTILYYRVLWGIHEVGEWEALRVRIAREDLSLYVVGGSAVIESRWNGLSRVVGVAALLSNGTIVVAELEPPLVVEPYTVVSLNLSSLRWVALSGSKPVEYPSSGRPIHNVGEVLRNATKVCVVTEWGHLFCNVSPIVVYVNASTTNVSELLSGIGFSLGRSPAVVWSSAVRVPINMVRIDWSSGNIAVAYPARVPALVLYSSSGNLSGVRVGVGVRNLTLVLDLDVWGVFSGDPIDDWIYGYVYGCELFLDGERYLPSSVLGVEEGRRLAELSTLAKLCRGEVKGPVTIGGKPILFLVIDGVPFRFPASSDHVRVVYEADIYYAYLSSPALGEPRALVEVVSYVKRVEPLGFYAKRYALHWLCYDELDTKNPAGPPGTWLRASTWDSYGSYLGVNPFSAGPWGFSYSSFSGTKLVASDFAERNPGGHNPLLVTPVVFGARYSLVENGSSYVLKLDGIYLPTSRREAVVYSGELPLIYAVEGFAEDPGIDLSSYGIYLSSRILSVPIPNASASVSGSPIRVWHIEQSPGRWFARAELLELVPVGNGVWANLTWLDVFVSALKSGSVYEYVTLDGVDERAIRGYALGEGTLVVEPLQHVFLDQLNEVFAIVTMRPSLNVVLDPLRGIGVVIDYGRLVNGSAGVRGFSPSTSSDGVAELSGSSYDLGFSPTLPQSYGWNLYRAAYLVQGAGLGWYEVWARYVPPPSPTATSSSPRTATSPPPPPPTSVSTTEVGGMTAVVGIFYPGGTGSEPYAQPVYFYYENCAGVPNPNCPPINVSYAVTELTWDTKAQNWVTASSWSGVVTNLGWKQLAEFGVQKGDAYRHWDVHWVCLYGKATVCNRVGAVNNFVHPPAVTVTTTLSTTITTTITTTTVITTTTTTVVNGTTTTTTITTTVTTTVTTTSETTITTTTTSPVPPPPATPLQAGVVSSWVPPALALWVFLGALAILAEKARRIKKRLEKRGERSKHT